VTTKQAILIGAAIEAVIIAAVVTLMLMR